jgi:hypothetical protein
MKQHHGQQWFFQSSATIKQYMSKCNLLYSGKCSMVALNINPSYPNCKLCRCMVQWRMRMMKEDYPKSCVGNATSTSTDYCFLGSNTGSNTRAGVVPHASQKRTATAEEY